MTLPRIVPLVLKRGLRSSTRTWLFELKYDGFRALLEIDGTGARPSERGNREQGRQLGPSDFVMFEMRTETRDSLARIPPRARAEPPKAAPSSRSARRCEVSLLR